MAKKAPKKLRSQEWFSREDIYGGKIVPFVPFTKLDGDKIVGTHNR